MSMKQGARHCLQRLISSMRACACGVARVGWWRSGVRPGCRQGRSHGAAGCAGGAPHAGRLAGRRRAGGRAGAEREHPAQGSARTLESRAAAAARRLPRPREVAGGTGAEIHRGYEGHRATKRALRSTGILDTLVVRAPRVPRGIVAGQHAADERRSAGDRPHHPHVGRRCGHARAALSLGRVERAGPGLAEATASPRQERLGDLAHLLRRVGPCVSQQCSAAS